MRICFITPDVFAWGGYGGLGWLTRTLGRELAKKGIEVYVLTPQKKGQKNIEQLDGMVVVSFPDSYQMLLLAGRVSKFCQADIYHVEDPYWTWDYLITRATPESKHIVSFQDPWETEALKYFHTVNPQFKGLSKFYSIKVRRSYLVRRIIDRADALFCPANYLIPKVKEMYNLNKKVGFLPNPVEIPSHAMSKSSKPIVCLLSRLEVVKRVERFFQLARNSPEVDFIVMGVASDKRKDKELREMASQISNLKMLGLLEGAEKNEILEKSWILANTSFHESLPTAFLEACAYKCAILSNQNPDDFALKFGFHVQNDDFESGLAYLLEGNRWKEKGEVGFEYVSQVHELNNVVDQHITVYENLLGKR